MKTTAFTLALLVLMGCATNNYEEFFVNKSDAGYDDLPTVWQGDEVKIKVAGDDNTIRELMNEGYILVGTSSFEGAYSPLVDAIDTAKRHDANLILTDIAYKGQKRYMSTKVVPTFSTSYDYGTVNATGYTGGGIVQANGTYSGTSTKVNYNVVPMEKTAKIYRHNVGFYRKIDGRSFYGIMPYVTKRVPGEEKDDFKILVAAVIRGSDAERDGIRVGERITAINGHPMRERSDFAKYGKSIRSISIVGVER